MWTTPNHPKTDLVVCLIDRLAGTFRSDQIIVMGCISRAAQQGSYKNDENITNMDTNLRLNVQISNSEMAIV
jgi:hypothetical protein